MNKKRILYITRTDPYLFGGGSQATKAFIEAFAYLYPDRVDLILADSCCANGDSLPVTSFFVPPRNFIVRLFSILTGSLHRFKEYVFNFLSERKNVYSLCVFNGSLIAGDMIDHINSLGIKTITIHHNYEKEYYTDNKSIESFKGFFPYYIIRNERDAFLKSNLNLFLTNQDKDTLERVYGPTNAINKFLGVFETKNSKITKSEFDVTSTNLVFAISGTLSSYQTITGMKDFNKNYRSIIKEMVPNGKIILTGRNPKSDILNIVKSDPGIYQLIPNPSEINLIIKKAHIYVCPTNIGGGIKLRIMDGLKEGLPILTHSISARGYDYFLNKPYFSVYNDSVTFISGLNRLMYGFQSKKWTGDEIQQDYKNFFGFDQGVSRLNNCLSSLSDT